MVGAVSGSPGTLPTGWYIAQIPAGLSWQIAGVGTEENGLPYIDFRMFGTPTTSQHTLLGVNNSATIGGAVAQSAWMRLVAGAFGGAQFTGGGGLSYSVMSPGAALPATLQRLTWANTATGTGQLWFQLNTLGVGVAMDATVRICGPQIEFGSVATALKPTSGSVFYGLRTADYSDDPTRPGIKIEPQATNLLNFSDSDSEFQVSGGTGGSVASGTITNVLGATGGWTITNGTGTFRQHNRVINNGQSLAASLHVLKTSALLYLLTGNTGGANGGADITFDPSTGSITRGSGVTVKNAGRFWRLETAWTNISGATQTAYVRVSCAGPTGSTVSLSGVQVENGLVCTSYIHTTGAAATRAADVWTFPVSAVPGWNAAAGSFVAEFKTSAANGPGVVQTTPTSVGAYLALSTGGGATTGWFASGVSSPTVQSGKKAIAFNNVGAFTAAGAGSTASLSSSDFTGLATGLQVGVRSNGSANLTGSIYALDYYPTALPANDLQRLTA
jgi:hypothetical protein